MTRRYPRTLRVAFYVINWTQIILGDFYLVCRMWWPGAFAVGTGIAVRVWFEWARERREAAQCSSLVHRDFTDAYIRCELPDGHQFHRSGGREWTP